MAISLTEIQNLLLPGLEKAMCGSKGSTPVSSQYAEDLVRAQLAKQQYKLSPYTDTLELANGYVLTRKAIEDNQYLAEAYRAGRVEPVPKIEARELTKEELRERVERKLDLSEAEATDPVELINLGRWRQVMDEVFKEEPKGDDDGKAEADGSGRGKRDDSGG